MKKFIKSFLGLFAALLVVVGLASCDKSGAIKSAYEKNGYTITETASSDDSGEKKGVVKILTVSNKTNFLDSAIIWVYDSKSSLKEAWTTTDDEGNKNTTKYDNAVSAGTIKENCYYFGTTAVGAFTVFKNA